MYKSKLKRHLADVHDFEVVWYACPYPTCPFRTKQPSGILRHTNDVHLEKIPEHVCDYCKEVDGHKFKGRSTLAHHILRFHPTRFVEWNGKQVSRSGKGMPENNVCQVKLIRPETHETYECGFSTFKKSEMQRHMNRMHDVMNQSPQSQCRFLCGAKSFRVALIKAHESACRLNVNRVKATNVPVVTGGRGSKNGKRKADNEKSCERETGAGDDDDGSDEGYATSGAGLTLLQAAVAKGGVRATYPIKGVPVMGYVPPVTNVSLGLNQLTPKGQLSPSAPKPWEIVI